MHSISLLVVVITVYNIFYLLPFQNNFLLSTFTNTYFIFYKQYIFTLSLYIFYFFTHININIFFYIHNFTTTTNITQKREKKEIT